MIILQLATLRLSKLKLNAMNSALCEPMASSLPNQRRAITTLRSFLRSMRSFSCAHVGVKPKNGKASYEGRTRRRKGSGDGQRNSSSRHARWNALTHPRCRKRLHNGVHDACSHPSSPLAEDSDEENDAGKNAPSRRRAKVDRENVPWWGNRRRTGSDAG